MAARTNYGNNVSALGPYSAEGNIGDYVNALNNDAASCNAESGPRAGRVRP